MADSVTSPLNVSLIMLGSCSIKTAHTKRVGVALLAVSLVQVVGMIHHPVAHGASQEMRVAEIAEMGALSSLVHGAMVFAAVVVWVLLGEFSAWRRETPLTRIAGRVYTLGIVAMVLAGLVNGFVASDFSADAVRVGGSVAASAPAMLAYGFSFNHALAVFGVLALSGGIAAWSMDLLRSGFHRTARLSGGYGLLASGGTCVALSTGLVGVGVEGMSAIVIAHALWYAAIGWLMIHGDRVHVKKDKDESSV